MYHSQYFNLWRIWDVHQYIQKCLLNGVSKTLNNSKNIFVRNGDGINYCMWIVGAVRMIPEYVYEPFNGRREF